MGFGSHACICAEGCDKLLYDGNIVNKCCYDWPQVAAAHCNNVDQNPTCGEQTNSKFGNPVKWVPKAVESKSTTPSVVITGVIYSCATECVHTAGCYRFNSYGSGEDASCELLLPDWSFVSTPPPSDWVTSGALSSSCTEFPFTDDVALVTELLCTFRAVGWTKASLTAAFLNANGVDAATPIGYWLTESTWDWAKSQLITAEVSTPFSDPNLVLTNFEITTWIRTKKENRRRRDTSIPDDILSLDSEMRALLQSQLRIPNGVEFVDTISITSKVKTTRNGVEVGDCQPTAYNLGVDTTSSTTTSTTAYFGTTPPFTTPPKLYECECKNGAVENDETGECEFQEFCKKNIVKNSINGAISNIRLSFENDSDWTRRRVRKAR